MHYRTILASLKVLREHCPKHSASGLRDSLLSFLGIPLPVLHMLAVETAVCLHSLTKGDVPPVATYSMWKFLGRCADTDHRAKSRVQERL